MLKRLRHEERGVAMILAVTVAFVILLLSTLVVAQSIHSIESSGYDRERVMSINAAEAGTNRWYAYLQTTPALSMKVDPGCNSSTGLLTISDMVQSGPSAAAYAAIGTFYGSDGVTTMNCSTFTDTNFPSFVKVRSTGTINGSPNRTLETYVRLTPNYGGFGAAILAKSDTTIANNFTINGSSGGNDGDIYILNGNFRVTNAMTLSGNVYVPNGTAQIENTSTVKGNVWANGTVTLQNSATIQGDALSSAGSITGTGTINDDATAAGSVVTTNLTIGGIITQGVTMPAVPTQTFPQITALTPAWIASGYTPVNYSANPGSPNKCAQALDWIKNTWPLPSSPTNALIRIDQTCNFTPPNNAVYAVKGNLAILSDGGFTFSQQSNWNGTSAPIKSIHFISVYSAAPCTGTKDITVGNNTNFDTFTNVSFYTPCRATMGNTTAFSGQVLSNDISINNNFKMNYKPVLVPGITGITGFKQDIAYIHE
jgi:hypothetical protein